MVRYPKGICGNTERRERKSTVNGGPDVGERVLYSAKGDDKG